MRCLLAAGVVSCFVACATPTPATIAAGPAVPRGPHGTLVGLARDTGGGDPLAFVDVIATDSHGHRFTDITDARGSYVLALPPGSYRVSARLARLQREFLDVAVFDGKATRLYFDFDTRAAPAAPERGDPPDLPRTGSITGVVLDGNGRDRFPGAVVTVTSPALGDAQSGLSDDRGHYVIPGLPPGDYVVEVYYQLVDRGAIELRRTGVAVVSGQATHVDLELDLRVDR